MVRFDLEAVLQGQTRTAKLKSGYNLLLIGPRGLDCKTNLQEIMGWGFSDVVRFGHGSLPYDGSLALVSCRSGGYKLALLLRCARSS